MHTILLSTPTSLLQTRQQELILECSFLKRGIVEINPPADSPTTSQEIVSNLGEPDFSEDTSRIPTEFQTIIPEYNNLNDPTLLGYIEDSVATVFITLS